MIYVKPELACFMSQRFCNILVIQKAFTCIVTFKYFWCIWKYVMFWIQNLRGIFHFPLPLPHFFLGGGHIGVALLFPLLSILSSEIVCFLIITCLPYMSFINGTKHIQMEIIRKRMKLNDFRIIKFIEQRGRSLLLKIGTEIFRWWLEFSLNWIQIECGLW